MSQDDPTGDRQRNPIAEIHSGLKWWHMLLIYPTALGVFLDFATTNIDRVMSWQSGISGYQTEIGKRITRFYLKNQIENCQQRSGEYSEQHKFQQIFCPSGDALVYLEGPNNEGVAHPILYEDMIAALQVTQSSGLFGTKANAATTLGMSQPAVLSDAWPDQINLAQFDRHVICVAANNGRYIQQKVRLNGQCFVERLDTRTGTVVNRYAAACSGGCS